MAQYATAAITAVTATAAITSSSGAYRHQDRLYRARNSDENSPWQHPQQRSPPFTSTRSRHNLGYYSQPLYYPASIYRHYAHHAKCPGPQCHYRAFLTDSIQRYNESRRELRQTYISNLRDLQRLHATQPRKSDAERHADVDLLYAYYVARVRAVFDAHRRDHRRLFGRDYLCWAPPEREEGHASGAGCLVRSYGGSHNTNNSHALSRVGWSDHDHDSGGGSGGCAAGYHGVGVGVDAAGMQVQGRTTTTVIRERTREGTGCDGEDELSSDEQQHEEREES